MLLNSLDAFIWIEWNLSCSFHYIFSHHSGSSRTSGKRGKSSPRIEEEEK